jgi:hypothetical protein
MNTLDALDEFEEGGFGATDFAIVKLLGKLGMQVRCVVGVVCCSRKQWLACCRCRRPGRHPHSGRLRNRCRQTGVCATAVLCVCVCVCVCCARFVV